MKEAFSVVSRIFGGLSPQEAGRVEPLQRLPRKTSPKVKDSPIYQFKATLRNVKTNVAVSLMLKAAFLVLAVLGVATLWMAVLADTGASVIVVANALRLLRTR